MDSELIKNELLKYPVGIGDIEEITQQEFEQEYLIRLLQMTEGNVTRAARLAKRNRTEFYKLLNKHHLEAAAFRQSD